MDIKALQLEARFSLPPNSLGYCGKDSAAEKFKECIIHGKCKDVEEELKHFIVLYPYLETIAEIANLPVFSYEVIESYWIGSDLLKKVKPEDYDLLLKNFKKQGVPDSFIKELQQKPPKVFIPNHLFQVLHVGVGRASGAVPFNLKSINNCMIRWGEVVKLIDGKAIINLHSLHRFNPSQPPLIRGGAQISPPDKGESEGVSIARNDNKEYALVVKKEAIPLDHELVPGLKTGDIVAAHWNMVVKILTKQEEDNLLFWVKEIL
ncbi:hypothetical protein KKF69_08485 [Patescibacteria group bacterium]|nr:hypothetical protein [Patescibacteria group bacterium]MBU4017482.1 hypothetical protein [Patescibacteria group bacterium]